MSWETSCHIISGQIARNSHCHANVLFEHFPDRAIFVTKSRGCSSVMKAIAQDVVLQNHLVIETVNFEQVRILFSKTSAPTVFMIEIPCIRHSEKRCVLHGSVREDIKVSMCGHLRFSNKFCVHGITPQSGQIQKGSMIFLAAKQHFIMRCEADMIRLFHDGKISQNHLLSNNRKKDNADLYESNDFGIFVEEESLLLDALTVKMRITVIICQGGR